MMPRNHVGEYATDRVVAKKTYGFFGACCGMVDPNRSSSKTILKLRRILADIVQNASDPP